MNRTAPLLPPALPLETSFTPGNFLSLYISFFSIKKYLNKASYPVGTLSLSGLLLVVMMLPYSAIRRSARASRIVVLSDKDSE
jgi:hypothetical protein